MSMAKRILSEQDPDLKLCGLCAVPIVVFSLSAPSVSYVVSNLQTPNPIALDPSYPQTINLNTLRFRRVQNPRTTKSRALETALRKADPSQLGSVPWDLETADSGRRLRFIGNIGIEGLRVLRV